MEEIKHSRAHKTWNEDEILYLQENKKQQEIIQSSCQKVNSRLDKKLKEISNYNKMHGTNYSYGQYTALKRLKKL